ncbi:MAG: 2-isopropylmalate synthase, partial [Lachnospiraceae bacterium]|nr:2-isopropylmalate synthase [Lachnospiraceae bacterium]
CWINRHYKLNGENSIDKKHPVIAKIKDWVDAEYAAGRITLISDEELETQIALHKDELAADGYNFG